LTLRVLAASVDAGSLITAIRVADPLRAALARRGGELRLESYQYVSHADLAWARVFVAQRGVGRRHWRLMRQMRERGGAVIYEIDDLLTEMAPHLAHHAYMERARPWVQRCLELADIVTAATPRLADALGVPSERCRIVPNAALACEDRPLPEPDPEAPVTLLFASSDHLAGDGLLPALQALQALQTSVGARLQVVGIGTAGADLAAVGIEVRRVPPLPRPQFADFARKLPNVVAVIPLDDSRFSACKSAIKWFDYAEVGVPTLASDLSPYRDVIRNDDTGALVANDEAAWDAALRRAIDDAGWRRRIATAARAEVRQRHHFGRTVEAWSQALDAAIEGAARRPVARRSLVGRWLGGVAGWSDGLMIAMRRANRDRLARRRARGARA
jgi:glycosyltransferase involved in cell wall biosynthesis